MGGGKGRTKGEEKEEKGGREEEGGSSSFALKKLGAYATNHRHGQGAPVLYKKYR